MHEFAAARPAIGDVSELPAPIARRRQSSLFRRYLVVLVTLVAVLLVLSGGVQSVVTYRDSRDALIRLQRAQAIAIAIQIRQLVDAVFTPIATTNERTRQIYFRNALLRREEYRRLLQQVPAVLEARYLD